MTDQTKPNLLATLVILSTFLKLMKSIVLHDLTPVKSLFDVDYA